MKGLPFRLSWGWHKLTSHPKSHFLIGGGLLILSIFSLFQYMQWEISFPFDIVSEHNFPQVFPIWARIPCLITLMLFSWGLVWRVCLAVDLDPTLALDYNPKTYTKLGRRHRVDEPDNMAEVEQIPKTKSMDLPNSMWSMALAATCVWLVPLIAWNIITFINNQFITNPDQDETFISHQIYSHHIYLPIVMAVIYFAWLFLPFTWIPWHYERHIFLSCVWRIISLTKWKNTVLVSDIILADVFTSFAKVFGDLNYMICSFTSGTSEGCGTGWLSILAVGLPSALRLRQCLTTFVQSDYKNTNQLWNALKYCSAFPVMLCSDFLKYSEGTSHSWLILMWFFFATINSVFSFYWDVIYDWNLGHISFAHKRSLATSQHRDSTPPIHIPDEREDLIGSHDIEKALTTLPPLSSTTPGTPSVMPSKTAPPRHYYFLRHSSMLHFPIWMYYLFIGLNLILRCSWSLKLSSHLHLDAELGIFILELLEILRRVGWCVLRLEVEVVKRLNKP